MDLNQPAILMYVSFILFIFMFFIIQNNKYDGRIDLSIFGDDNKYECPIIY